jgi:hypothetical protein
MQLERLSLDLRRRNGWETLDLGLAMLRAWRWPVLASWLATYWPFALAVTFLLWDHPGIAALIVWWSKPFFDRVLLFVYGRAVFGVQPRVREVWREIPRLAMRTSLLAGLTLHRLSWARPLFLPIWQLEGQRGRSAAARRRLIGMRAHGYAAWLTFFCAHFAAILLFGQAMLVLALLPQGVAADFSLLDWFAPQSPLALTLSRVLNVFTFAAETMIEPYFVAAGFSLYLNRRSELEGWDIEVAFRRMSARHERRGTAVAAALVALSLCCGLLAPELAWAQDVGRSDAEHARTEQPVPAARPAAPIAYPEKDVSKRVKSILEDPVFGRKETHWRYEYGRQPEETKPEPSSLSGFFRWLAGVMRAIAEGGRVLMWIAIALALAAAVYLVIRHREKLGLGGSRRAPPEMMFGLDVRPQSLPADVAGAASELLARGDRAGALSLLYRGALSALIHGAGVEFRPGDTEGDCWRRAGPVLDRDGTAYFRALLDAWLLTAYGHRALPVEELQSLCQRWARVFSAAASLASTGEARA